jgi:VWFA-related protein
MRKRVFFLAVFALVACSPVLAQTPEPKRVRTSPIPPPVSKSQIPPPEQKQQVRTVTIPISIFTKRELKEKQAEEFVQADRLIVHEDKDEQQILSIRSVSNSPLSIALVIQEDLATNFNLQIKDIQSFIRDLPKGTRVLVAYMRSGSVEIRQRFTDDLERAASSLRIVSGSPTLAPRSPYDGVSEVLSRFDAVPAGRRAILLFSDGLDTTEGMNLASVAQSFTLEQAISKAQRRSVAVYSFWSPTTLSDGDSTLALAAEGALDKLSDETGGRAFSHGTIAPISYMPFFKDMVLSLNRQFSLTYLSTHMKKGYHRVDVESTNPEVKIDHPKGYNYR